ncbi:SPRY domain-containing protein 7 [Liparis tanakae]|uniref:SPRY domain-containing protein 7 n=1 Tax=Liparis tanakae TaxID=230148 RepID=A0A4Z2ENC7_9TELE|nr:SPRY domain-containing protein 7 [Liparis tanakae]
MADRGTFPSKKCPLCSTDVVIVKSGRRICGTGGCLANAPLHQNKSYFEFKIQSTGKSCSGDQLVSIRCRLDV